MAQPVRILSLDGGGVRGISSLYILKELMAQVARQYRVEHPQIPRVSPRPCEYFDLICGTSTGGLIALMLGRLRMVIKLDIKADLFARQSMKRSKNIKHFPERCLQANQNMRRARLTT